jgi:hypothetical protein
MGIKPAVKLSAVKDFQPPVYQDQMMRFLM